MASFGSANRSRSPGRSAAASRAIPSPTRACSREVRGRRMPCRAKTYFVKPEQSKPLSGVFPPQVYGVPTYWPAVSSTRAAAAVGAGDRGIRTPEEPDPPEPLEPDALLFASTASPIITAAESTVDGEIEIIPCAQPQRRSSEDASAGGRTRRRRGVMPVARQLRRHGCSSSQRVAGQQVT